MSPLICLISKELFSHKSGFSYLSSIERRVESVEETLQSLQRHITGLPNYGLGKHSDITLPSQSSGTGTAQLELQEGAETTDSVDAMGALVFANEEESGFFGRFPITCMTKATSGVLITNENRPLFQYCISTSRIRRCNACN